MPGHGQRRRLQLEDSAAKKPTRQVRGWSSLARSTCKSNVQKGHEGHGSDGERLPEVGHGHAGRVRAGDSGLPTIGTTPSR